MKRVVFICIFKSASGGFFILEFRLMKRKKKIIIVGGGATGLSTALQLAEQSKHEIVLFEKGYVGTGQTGECCGFIRTYYNVKEMAFSALESMRYIKRLVEKSSELEFVHKGLIVINSLESREETQSNVEMLQKLGVNAEYMEGTDINQISPYLKTDDVCAGIDYDAGYVNPQLMVGYLRDECKRLGVTIHEGAEITGIGSSDGKFTITTSIGRYHADKLVNATGAYANKINAMIGVVLPMKVIQVRNAFYRLPLEIHGNCFGIADFVNQFYLIPHKEFVDVSSMVLDLNRQVDPVTGEFNFPDQVAKDYLATISKRIIGSERSASIGGFSTNIDVTPDYYPIVSAIDSVPNYYCATGFSGTGYKHFPMVGKILAELVLDKDPEFPKLRQFFRFDRFGDMTVRKNVSDSYFVE